MNSNLDKIAAPSLGLLGGIAAILQIAAGILPGPGHLISVFATLPLIIAGLKGIKASIFVYLTASFIIFIIQPLETPIFLLATGLLGLVMGISISSQQQSAKNIVAPGLSLGTGLLILVRIFGIPVFAGLTFNFGLIKALLFIYLFSIAYSFLWYLFWEKVCSKYFSFYCDK